MNGQTLISAQTKGASHRATHDAVPRSGDVVSLRQLFLDPWIVLTAVLSGLFLAVPHFDWLGAGTRLLITEDLSTIVLLAVAVGAVLQGVKPLKSQRERAFWRLVGLSLSAWLAGETLAFFFLDSTNARAGIGVDALYLTLYLGLVLALDTQPQSADGDLRIRPLRVLASAGRVLLVTGIFAYFVLLPRTIGVEQYLTWVPSFSFYVILDIYLVGRFIHATIHARSQRWRLMCILLTSAWTFVLATDSVDFAWISSHLPDSLPYSADIFWFAPMILIVAASRSRYLSFATTEGPGIDDDDDRIKGVPLLVYSLGFALLHLGVSAFDHTHDPLQNSRVVLVALYLLVFGILNFFQNAIIERQSCEQRLRRREAEEHILSLSLQDPLTRLLNRRAFDSEFARAVARAERTGSVLALMFVDLDHFKEVNDTWGHSAGDGILREAAARIKAFTREVDTLARYGGDEFVLVFEALEDPSAAEIVGGRILDGFKMGFQFESVRIQLSASIGIAVFPGHGRTPSELFEAADRAMYRVKEAGGSGIAFA